MATIRRPPRLTVVESGDDNPIGDRPIVRIVQGRRSDAIEAAEGHLVEHHYGACFSAPVVSYASDRSPPRSGRRRHRRNPGDHRGRERIPAAVLQPSGGSAQIRPPHRQLDQRRLPEGFRRRLSRDARQVEVATAPLRRDGADIAAGRLVDHPVGL
jgi:hypothetical protein